jgi:radical SAM protein with 4Fe4S-binding SPASM domain
MGNLKDRPDWVVSPEQVNDIIDFCYETALQGEIKVFPADCVGYYTDKEIKVRQISYRTGGVPMWEGCNAGVRGFGILHNGDILGCTSIRDDKYIEGNIKDSRLRDIWDNPDGFAWRRNMAKKDLSGDCAICIYGSKCLGGCPNTRLTMNGDIYSENLYCSYNYALKRLRKSIESKTDVNALLEAAKRNLKKSDFQTAALLAGRASVLQPGNSEALEIKGFAEFMCGNYAESEEANRNALEIEPGNTYAMKGLGLALHRQGKSQEGLSLLEEAAKLTGYSDRDILEDLAVVKREMSSV